MDNIYESGMRKIAADNTARNVVIGTAGAVGGGMLAAGALDKYKLSAIPAPTLAEKTLAGLQSAHTAVSDVANKGLGAMKSVENAVDTAGMFYGGYSRADVGGALHHLVHGDPVAASKALRLTPKHEYALLNRLNQIRSNPSDPLHAHIQTAEGLKQIVQETAQSGRDFLGRAGGILSRGILR